MADFKFSCPQCAQHILCDSNYAGVQINCPTCNQSITVPPAPPRPAAAPVAPPPTRLMQRPVSASPQHAAAPMAAAPAPAQKSGSSAMKIVLVIVCVIAGLAALGGGGWFGWHLYSQHKAKVAQAVAAKGNPDAQVSAPSSTAAAGAEGIMVKVAQAYSNLKSLNLAGTTVMAMDMSAITMDDINAGSSAAKKKPTTKKSKARPMGMPAAITNKANVTIKLARPDLYRIEGTSTTVAGPTTMTNTMAAWSTGNTNYMFMAFGGGAYKNYTTAPDRKTAFMMNGQAGVLAIAIPQLFFGETDQIGKLVKDWGQTEDDSVDGQDCVTLTAKLLGQKLKIWVSKANYMVLQSEVILGAPISDEDITTAISTFDPNTNKTPQQLQQETTMAKQQAAMMTKIRGSIIENYKAIETDAAYAADDFNYPVPHGVRLGAPPQFGGPRPANSSSKTSQRNVCINNLRQIDAAKNQFALEQGKKTGDPVTEADIKPYIKLDADGNLPKCPAGGKYTIGKVGENPTCSIDGHVLP